MTNHRILTRSFAGGEITPELFGRVALGHYQTGLKTCKNAVVLPHGPANARSGFEYVLQARDAENVRLIPFSFNTEQTYIIELGPQYMRFHTRPPGASTTGTVLEGAPQNLDFTGITQASPGVVTYDAANIDPANGDWIFLTLPDGMVELNARYVKVTNLNTSLKTFELFDLHGDGIDTSGYTAFVSGDGRAVSQLTTPYGATDLFEIGFTQNADIMTLVHPNYPVYELSRTDASTFALTLAVFEPGISVPKSMGATATVGAGAVTYRYVATAVDNEGFEESVASASAECTNDLTTAGNYNTVDWKAPDTGDPVRYNVYKQQFDDGLYGYIGRTDGLTFQDQNIIADMSVTPPITEDPFDAVSDYPGAVSYFEQRKIFGATDNRPQNYWMTRSGTERNMSRSLPTQADDSIRGRIVAQQINEIRHFVPLTDLLVLTVGGEWVISSPDGGALAPGSIRVRPQSYEGASKVMPQVTGSRVLYVEASGSRVQEIKYSWESSSYISEDASIMAPHLVDGSEITQMAYSKSPGDILWAVRDDGVLLGLTFVPEHEVRGWHQHNTDGLFKSVAVVSESEVYGVYVVVQRDVNGSTYNYIERLHDTYYEDLEDYFGVDSGLTYDGASVSSVSGLWHLEGETVQILGDGAVLAPQVVTNGGVSLSSASSKVHIGLQYRPEIELLPLSIQASDGGQGRAKSPTSARIRVHKTGEIKIGADLATARHYDHRSVEPFGSAPDMMSAEVDITLDVGWGQDGSVYITRDNPLPMNLVSLTLGVEIGG